MSYVFRTTYLSLDTACRWLRGNHHGHSKLSDGQDDPYEILSAYEAAGYDYFALSEHDLFVDPSGYRGRTSMVVLPAVEITSVADQTLMYLGATADIPQARSLSMPEIARFVDHAGGLFIVDHPNWFHKSLQRHATVEEIAAVESVRGIEIYSGAIERLPGSPYAVEVWDALLTMGRHVFGHAVDDQHRLIDRFLGWNCVQSPAGAEPTPDGVIRALSQGRFYATTGVRIDTVGVSDDGTEITIVSDANEVRWFTRDGMLAGVTPSGSANLSVSDLRSLPRLEHFWRETTLLSDAIYVRAELAGKEGTRAWTQPFHIEGSGF